MSYIQSQLAPKETIIFQGKIHPIMFLKPLLISLVWLLFFHTLGWYFWLVCIWIYFILKYITIELAVTDRQVICKQGIISVDCATMELAAIEGIRIKKSLLGMILGYGTLLICGRGGKNIGVPLLCNPEKFKAQLYALAERNGKR